MGFWYYCAESCCGASAYRWSPPLNQFAGGGGYGRIGEYATEYQSIDWRPPLLGNSPAITRQSDGWVLLRGRHGIRSDGSLWGGYDRLLPMDPGPWKWVTENSTGGAGIKSDGTLWTWGQGQAYPGDGSVGGWGGSYGSAQGVHARIDCKLVGFPDLDDYQRGFTFSPDGLAVTIEGCQPNEGSGLTAEVFLIDGGGGGSGYSDPPSVNFDPPGAQVTPVVLKSGSLSPVSFVSNRGAYNYTPKVTVSPPPAWPNGGQRAGSSASARLQLDEKSSKNSLLPKIGRAKVYYIEVNSAGSKYTLPPEVSFDPPGAAAEAILDGNGGVSFIRVTSGGEYGHKVSPSISVSRRDGDSTGGGCEATPHIEGIVSEVEILDPGSYTRTGVYGEWYALAGWSNPPPSQCIGRLYRAEVTNSGGNYLKPAPPAVTISGSGSGAKAVAYANSDGVVTKLEVTSQGSGYVRPKAPRVLVTGEGSGAVARARVGLDGKVSGVSLLTSGADYKPETTSVVFLPPVLPDMGDGATGFASVGGNSSIAGVSVTSPGSGYFTPDVSVSFQSTYGTGAKAFATVDASGTVTGLTLLSGGGGYYEPAPPIVSFVSGGSGSGGEVRAEVDVLGKVTSLYVAKPGSGYDPELYDDRDPFWSLSFSPQAGSLGSGGQGRVYVISKYRHPTNTTHLYKNTGGEVTGEYSMRGFLSYAQLSPGGVVSISVDEPIPISSGLLSGSGGWNPITLPVWRIAGGTGKLVESYGAPPFYLHGQATLPFAEGAGAKYEGEVGGAQITHVPLPVGTVPGSVGLTTKLVFDPPGAEGFFDNGTLTITKGGEYLFPPSAYGFNSDGSKMAAVVCGLASLKVTNVVVGFTGELFPDPPSIVFSSPYATAAAIMGPVDEYASPPGAELIGVKLLSADYIPAGKNIQASVVRKDGTTSTTSLKVTVTDCQLKYPELDGLKASPRAAHRVWKKRRTEGGEGPTGLGWNQSKCPSGDTYFYSGDWPGGFSGGYGDYISPASGHIASADIEININGEGIWSVTQFKHELKKTDTGARLLPTKLATATGEPISGYSEPSVTAKWKFVYDWNLDTLVYGTHPGEFQFKSAPLPTTATAVKQIYDQHGPSEHPVIEAKVIDVGGKACIQSFTAKTKGYGFLYEPNILYSNDLPYFRQVGKDSNWTNVEAFDGYTTKGHFVAIKGGELYWWGDIRWGGTGLSSPSPVDTVAYPVRVGNSAIIKATSFPDGFSYRSEVWPTVEVSPPDAGWAAPIITTGGLPAGPVAGHFESPWGIYNTALKYANIPAFTTRGSTGYTSPPTVKYHSYDGTNPFKIVAELRGPDGTAKQIFPVEGLSSSADSHSTAATFGVLGNDGSAWRWGTGGVLEPGSVYNPLPTFSTTTHMSTRLVSDGFTSKHELCNPWTTTNHVVDVVAPGEGYTSAVSVKATSQKRVEEYVPPTVGTACNGDVQTYVESCPKASQVAVTSHAHLGSRDRHGRILDTGLWFGPIASVDGVTVAVEGGGGSGLSLAVRELTEPVLPGGWEKANPHGVSFTHVQVPFPDWLVVAIDTSGKVRRGSGFATKDLDGAVSLSVGGKAAWHSDGRILVHDRGLTARHQGELEAWLTDSGADLRLPPLAEVSNQLSSVATATATIDGKVVAFGVMDRGSGYTKQPTIELKSHTTGGTGAEGLPHICGPVVAVSVDQHGGGYLSPPLVTFSRPGMPAEATCSMTGYVSSVSLISGGSGYSTPPPVLFSGDGTGATATAAIRGRVESIIVTEAGDGYLVAPRVSVAGGGGSGATAVAFLSSPGRGVITVEVTDGGSGYTSPPTIAFESDDTPARSATAEARINAGVSSITLTGGGGGYASPPLISIPTGTATAAAGLSLSVKDVSIKSGGRYWNSPPTVSQRPDHCVSSISVDSKGSGYSSAPQVLVVGGTGSGAEAACCISGSVSFVTVTEGGEGYTEKFPPYVAFSGGLDVASTGLRTAKAAASVSSQGRISSVVITDSGSGYDSNPSVFFKSPQPAYAVAKVEDGKVTAVTVVNAGAYYAATPEVRFIPTTGGRDAEATATITGGSIESISVTNGGEGYEAPPRVVIWYGSAGTGAEAFATISASVTGIVAKSPGFGYRIPPHVIFIGGGGGGAKATANVSQNGSGAKFTAKINGSVEYIELKQQGEKYQFPPEVKISAPDSKDGSPATAQARILGKISSFAITRPGSGYADTKKDATLYNFYSPLPSEMPCQAIAMIDGVGYAERPHYVSFGASGGKVTESPTPPANLYFTQRPAVTFINGIGVRAATTLMARGFGVDHIGSDGSGSKKPSLGDLATTSYYSKAWPLENARARTDAAGRLSLGLSTDDVIYLPGNEMATIRPVWRGAVANASGTAAGASPNKTTSLVPPLADSPTIFLENERGKNATTAVSGDFTTGKARVTAIGGEDYISRYNTGDVLFTLEKTFPLWRDNPAKASAAAGPSGSVVSVSLDAPGGGYINPVAHIHGGGGSGATAAVFYSNDGGAISKVVLTSAGSGYTSDPEVLIVDSAPVPDPYKILSLPAEYIAPDRPHVTSKTGVLDFVELASTPQPLDTEVIKDRTNVFRAHVFYDTGSAVDVRFAYPKEGRWSPSFAEKHDSGTVPEIKFTTGYGAPPAAKSGLVKWHPPVGDGSAIRDTSE